MVLIDFPQLAYATILQHMAYTKVAVIEEKVAKILVLDTIRANIKKFKRLYGPTVVISIDDKEYWRRGIFPQYKHSRKESRDASIFDWGSIFTALNTIKLEFKEILPYKVLCVPKAESDDIIAVLSKRYCTTDTVVIVSGDKDFNQLSCDGVSQYSPVQKQFLKISDPSKALKELIIRGDKGDGIPNILSGDDSFTHKIRQKPIREDKLAIWLNQKPEEFCTNETMLRNFRRNEMLIDFNFIPSEIAGSISKAFDECETPSRGKLFDYLVSQKMSQLVECVDEF